MNEIYSPVKCKGDVLMLIDWKDGRHQRKFYRNTVLKTGRRVMALMLANQIGDAFSFYISRMIFGDGGTDGGVKNYVSADRNGLFGTVRLAKPVIASFDSFLPTQVIFTSTIKFEEAVGLTLNEMALQMSNGDLYSMITFSDFTKTEEMSVTWQWRLNFI